MRGSCLSDGKNNHRSKIQRSASERDGYNGNRPDNKEESEWQTNKEEAKMEREYFKDGLLEYNVMAYQAPRRSLGNEPPQN